MTRSLGEVEATARKAARGAGYAWGLAEDAGLAVRWLEARGIDGCAALVATLQAVDAGIDAYAPKADWASASGVLCPIGTGAALSDQAAVINGKLALGSMLAPVLLLPALAFIAGHRARPVTLETDSACVVVESSGVQGDALGVEAAAVQIQLGLPNPDVTRQDTPLNTRADVPRDTWDALDHFAAKTYAPATEESRLIGAGAGLTDND